MALSLQFQLLTPSRLVSRSEGEAFLRLVDVHIPEAYPDRVGNYEPIRQKVTRHTATEFWDDPFLWKSAKNRAQGSVWMQPHTIRSMHGWITLESRENAIDQERIVRFVMAAATLLDADFALLHLLNAHYVVRGRATQTASAQDSSGKNPFIHVTTHNLRRGLPDLYWLTVFGPPYVEMFGRQALRGAPAFRVEELETGAIALQLSENYADCETTPELIEDVRRRVIGHLTPKAFFDPDDVDGYRREVPTFRLS